MPRKINGNEAWNILVLRYADGRKPCNCGEAYYGRESGRCDHGCQANQFAGRRIVARGILRELGILSAENTLIEEQPPREDDD